jgi:hypothetical protein
MKSFESYKARRELAETILNYNIDVDLFVESLKKLFNENDTINEDILNEKWVGGFGGIVPGLARGVAGLAGMGRQAAADVGGALGSAGGALGRGAMSAGGALGRGAMSAGGALGRGAMSAGRTVGGAVGDAAQAVGQGAVSAGRAVGGAAQAVGQHYGQAMADARQQQAMKQITDRLAGLEDAMQAVGFTPDQTAKLTTQINGFVTKKLQQAQQQVA